MSPARHLSELNRTEGSVLSLDGGPRAAVSQDRVDNRSYEHRASWRFRNWRVRSKIIAILLVPLLAVVALSALRLTGVFTDMRQAGRAQQVAGLASRATALADELQAERDLSGAFVGKHRGYGGKELHTERGRVDQAIRDYQQAEQSMSGSYGPVVDDLVTSVDKRIQQLKQQREAVDRGLTAWSALFDDYTSFVADLISIEENIPQGSNDTTLAAGVRALSTLSRAKALLSAERGSLDYLIGSGKADETQFRDFLNLDARYQAAQDEFSASITRDQRGLYQSKVTGVITSPVETLTKKAMTSPSQAVAIDLPTWYAKTSAMIQKMRVVEVAFDDQVFDRANVLHRNAQRQAALSGGVVLAVLVITFVFALMVARSLVRPLRRLRSTATEVAHHRLPQSVQRLRSTAAGDLDAEVEPVRINSGDEVGEVAGAFNVVHREAVRVAVEQAVLRHNVSTMFVNLSRRTQSLVERQLRLIDDLEVNEEDNDSLGNLFQLDHLATRMRRNAENLLVLAGADSGRRWNHPVVLIDVLRAAAAEVEQYPRVAQTYVTTRQIDGRAVGDVVHLVAELLENALEFSSPETQVVVSARSLNGETGVLVEIEDRGIGMSADELAAANERLATAAEIDVSLSRMMGLYVVGKLAARHSIGVQLRHAPTGGVLAQIHLPSAIVMDRASGMDEMEAYMQARAAEGPVPVAAGAAGGGELADLGDHETRPIIVERTRTRPRSLPRSSGDGPAQPLGEPPPAEPDEVASSTGTFQLPNGMNALLAPPSAEDVGSGTGTHRFRASEIAPATGFAPTGGSGDSSGPHHGTESGRPDTGAGGGTGPPPTPALPEFDFNTDIAEALSPAPGAQGLDGTDPGQNGHQVTASGLPRREAGSTLAPGPDPQAAAFPSPPPAGHTGPDTSPGQVPGDTGARPSEPQRGAQMDLFPPAVPVPPVPPRQPTEPAPQSVPMQQAGPEATTGPAGPAAAGEKPEAEYLPIYAQIESEWFRRRSRPGSAAQPRPDTASPPPAAAPSPVPSWESAADEGWRAAEQIAKPRVSGTTRAGLPIRQPQAHYVPGSAGPGGVAGGPRGTQPAGTRPGQPGPGADPARSPDGQGPRPESTRVRSPEAVRGLLSSYHRGLRQGREAGYQEGADGDEIRTE